MTAQPRRRFWQIHLSTALVLTFVAGGAIWLNFKPSYPAVESGEYLGSFEAVDAENRVWFSREYGWPMPAHYIKSPGEARVVGETQSRFWFPTALIVDALVAVGLIAFTAFGCEFTLRRREARP